MAEQNHYFYPDKNDALISKFITEKQPFEGYWAKSEKFVLERMRTLVRTHTENRNDAVFLDAGCGTGRLLSEFQEFFKKIVAIDPDRQALEAAKETSRERSISEKVIFQNASIEKFEWQKRSIDVILCSHVLQHVHTDSIMGIIDKLSQLLSDNGLLLLTTTYSKKDRDFYTKMYCENQRVVEQVVDKNEFNLLINNGNGVLPVHFFSKKKLLRILSDFGFKMIEFKSFHILNRMALVDRIIFRDHFVNSLPLLQGRMGRDMFIACRKI